MTSVRDATTPFFRAPRDGAVALRLGDVAATALASGALWLPEARALAVADLHLGKAARTARFGGALLPPYETAETLARLAVEVARLDPLTIVLLGDSFDDATAAASMTRADREALARLSAGRRVIWIAGNHDPAPTGLGGEAAAAVDLAGLRFTHVADPAADRAEVSGHYHPKACLPGRGRRLRLRCFLHEGARLVLPAFGAYAGGLDATDAAFDRLFSARATAVLCGRGMACIPRGALGRRAA